MPKQKTVRVSDPDLLAECSELLSRQIGQTLPQATIVNAALVALKNQHVHQLVTVEDAAQTCNRTFLPRVCQAVTETINLLGDARLLVAGNYTVEGDPDTCQLSLFKDGIKVIPLEETEKVVPEWAEQMAAAMKKTAVN